jgi:hypothetical protein
MARLTGQRVVIRSLRLDDLEPVVMGRTKLAEQGSLTDHPDYEHLRAQLPHWSDLRDGRVNLGVEVDGRLVGEIQTFQPDDRPAGPGAAVCEVGLSLYDAVDRGRWQTVAPTAETGAVTDPPAVADGGSASAADRQLSCCTPSGTARRLPR